MSNADVSSLWQRGDVEQFIRASIAVYQEALDGGRENRDFYLSAVIPGVYARGTRLEKMVTEGYRTHLVLLAHCSSLLPDDVRLEGARWMADFAVSWMSEVFHRTLELESKAARHA